MIRWVTIFILAVFIGCSTSPAIKKQEKVQIVKIETKIPQWATIDQLEGALRDGKTPDYILLSTMKCRTCIHLHKIMEKMEWTSKVIFLNIEEPWVKNLIKGVNIKVIPTLVVTLDGGARKTVGFSGLEGITTALFHEFNVKKQTNR